MEKSSLFHLGCWARKISTYVSQHNLQKLESKTLDQCQDLCEKNSRCVAIEFYHHHGAEPYWTGKDYWKEGDCWLNSAADVVNTGDVVNTDIYIKTCKKSK